MTPHKTSPQPLAPNRSPSRHNYHRRLRPFKVAAAAAAVDREGETWIVESTWAVLAERGWDVNAREGHE
jgi:hypothetical protein